MLTRLTITAIRTRSFPHTLTPLPDGMGAIASTTMHVLPSSDSEFGGRPQVIGVAAEGLRLDIGDAVCLRLTLPHAHQQQQPRHVVLAMTCGIDGHWKDRAGPWARHVMCNLLQPAQLFYLVCDARWAVHPVRIREAFNFVSNGLREVQWQRHLRRLGSRQPAENVGLRPGPLEAALYVVAQEREERARASPRQRERMVLRITSMRLPGPGEYGKLTKSGTHVRPRK